MEKLVKYVKSKTIIFSAVLAVLGVFELNLGLLQEALGGWFGVYSSSLVQLQHSSV